MVRRIPLLPLALLLAGCSGGSGGPPGGAAPGAFSIVSCSLGCVTVSGAGGAGTAGCTVNAVAANEEIAVQFSAPVDLESVTTRSFSVTDLASGARPPGTFALDPADPRRLIFRAELGFDSQGLPLYGLAAGRTYSIEIPAAGIDPGPDFVRSVGGVANGTRLACSVVALDAVFDVDDGPPRALVFLDLALEVDPDTGEVLEVEKNVLASGDQMLEDVYRRSRVRMVFDDLMDPATLVNPVSNLSNTLSVGVDADGDLDDLDDLVPVQGDWFLSFDYAATTTTVTFTPSVDIPSRGPDEASPRLLVVELSEEVADLGGHPLENPGLVAGVPELRAFPPAVLPDADGEDFSTTEHRDEPRTGAVWGPLGLAPGSGGGSGRLGDFRAVVDDGLVVLDTDGQVFESPNVLDNYDPVTGMPGGDVLVEDGVFEFTSFHVGVGGRVRLVGSHPARILARGDIVVDGLLDASGEDVPERPSMPCDPLELDGPNDCETTPSAADFLGGAGGAAGAAGGAGGRGGDLPDSDETLAAVGGLDNPNPVIVTHGRPGEGIPFPSALDPQVLAGAGEGGLQWPDVLPTNASEVGTFSWDIFQCITPLLGGSGAGGAHATPGGDGRTGTAQIFIPNTPPEAVGGDVGALLDEEQRELAPEHGHLRGGGGGGGGGAHATHTKNQNPSFPCLPATGISIYRPSIGNGGGGGGGAVELHAGTKIEIRGEVAAHGGHGGDVIPVPLETSVGAMERVSAGGGGAGGAILVRSPELSLTPLPARLSVEGGRGGIGIADPDPEDSVVNFSLGGDGGAGFVRLEVGETPPDFDEMAGRVAPAPDEVGDLLGSPAMEDLLSVAAFTPRDEGPEARSGAQSCWLQPPGHPFLVAFPEDGTPSEEEEAAAGLDELGWDMDVFVAGVGPVSWRRPGALFPGASLEELLGSDLGAAPVVVRFQGARALVPVGTPCNVAQSGPASPLHPGSITPWVRHPAELNGIFESAALKPNLVRYQIVFDRSHPFSPLVEGVSRIALRARPE